MPERVIYGYHHPNKVFGDKVGMACLAVAALLEVDDDDRRVHPEPWLDFMETEAGMIASGFMDRTKQRAGITHEWADPRGKELAEAFMAKANGRTEEINKEPFKGLELLVNTLPGQVREVALADLMANTSWTDRGVAFTGRWLNGADVGFQALTLMTYYRHNPEDILAMESSIMSHPVLASFANGGIKPKKRIHRKAATQTRAYLGSINVTRKQAGTLVDAARLWAVLECDFKGKLSAMVESGYRAGLYESNLSAAIAPIDAALDIDRKRRRVPSVVEVVREKVRNAPTQVNSWFRKFKP